MGVLGAISRTAERYCNWYDKNIQPGRTAANYPKCIFCGKRDYIAGPITLTNSRVMNQFLRCIMTCKGCGMRYQASRLAHSRKWYFNIST